jgi:hypothetical protein
MTGGLFAAEPIADRELATLVWWMMGSFSSRAQSQEDPDFLHIVLHVTRIWRGRPDGKFEGSTLGRLCSSHLRGSTWASSEVVIGPDGLVSWDRGWDDDGAQKWGSVKAGYRFDRVGGAE